MFNPKPITLQQGALHPDRRCDALADHRAQRALRFAIRLVGGRLDNRVMYGIADREWPQLKRQQGACFGT